MTKNASGPTVGASPTTARPSTRTAGGVVLRAVPAVVVLAAAGWMLGRTNTPFWSVVAYAAVFVWTVMVPGVLLARLLVGRGTTLVADLGYGGAIGLLYQLLGWAVCVGTGAGRFILAWPLLAVLAAVLSRRRRPDVFRPRHEERLPTVVSWALVPVFLLALRWFATIPFTSALPNAANQWYKDEYFHLGMAAMFKHQVLPQVPQVAGETLHYHWFVHAHMAAMSLGSGVDLAVIVTRLYMLPLLGVLMCLFVAVLHDLTRSTWPGALAFALTTGASSIRLQDWFGANGLTPLAANSPSQNLSVVFLLLILGLITRFLRKGVLSAGEWLVLLVALFAGPGAKSSTLPILFAGAVVALLAAGATRSRWRRFTRAGRPVLLVGIVLVVLLLTAPFIGGGGTGSHLQLFAIVRRSPVWSQLMDLDPQEAQFSHALLAPGVLTGVGFLMIVLLLLSYVVNVLWVVAAWNLLVRQRSIAAWFLFGVGLGGFAAMMVIDHPGLSEVYFLAQGMVAWQVLTAWGMWEAVERARLEGTGRRVAWTVVAAAIGGWALLQLIRRVTPYPGEPRQYLPDLALGLLPVAVSALAVWVFRRRLTAVLALGVLSAIVGAGLIPDSWPGAVSRQSLDSLQVTADETAAARWLRDHSQPGQVVATNVHCAGLRQVRDCDARAFWVSGFTERPVLIEGWGYTDEALAAAGRDGLTFTRVPFKDPALFEVNESAFYHPTDETMQTLRSRGVVWLFADSHRRFRPLSKFTGRHATEVFRNGDVTIYRIEKP